MVVPVGYNLESMFKWAFSFVQMHSIRPNVEDVKDA